MTPCYFPAVVESWGFRWNVTVFKARGSSIASQFSGSIYSLHLPFLDRRKLELNSGQSRGIPCAITPVYLLKQYTDAQDITSRYSV